MRETLANKDRLLVFSKPDLADQRAVTVCGRGRPATGATEATASACFPDTSHSPPRPAPSQPVPQGGTARLFCKSVGPEAGEAGAPRHSSHSVVGTLTVSLWSCQIVSGLLTDMKPRFKSVGSIFVVMGMPNVGKSTLVNAVRRHAMPMASGKRSALLHCGILKEGRISRCARWRQEEWPRSAPAPASLAAWPRSRWRSGRLFTW